MRLMTSMTVACSLISAMAWGSSNEGPHSRIVDLTHAFDKDTVYWPTADDFEMDVDFRGETDGGWHYESNTIRTSEHGGTHLDAPIHFAAGRQHVDEIPLDHLMGQAVLVDVSRQAAVDRNYQVSIQDLLFWEERHGKIPDRAILLIHTGFGERWPDRTSYMGTDERGAQAVSKLHFPGLHPEAAQWLVKHRTIHAVGLDTPSIDYGQSSTFMTHRILFAENIPAFENVANLGQLPTTGFEVIALPMKIRGGSGGPLRIIAIMPEHDAVAPTD